MTFLDTSALYAVLDRDDEHHPAAKIQWQTLLASDEALLVTNYVLLETAALVQHRLGMDALRALCSEILPALEVHWIGESDHAHALNALLAANRRQLSLVDCSSVHVMRTRSLRTVFAFDPHFREQGLFMLPPEPPA